MAESSKLKTGIFSGSFNPIHIGHLALANYLCEYEGLDEIWFMTSPQNPLKAGTELWPDELRLRLVELATEGYPHFHASDFEFHLPRPSYSVHTLEKLHEAYPEREFYLIIGSDNWTRFDRWYQSERYLYSSGTRREERYKIFFTSESLGVHHRIYPAKRNKRKFIYSFRR